MENLEDTSTGGRVTRSLRKRLTSVDSDASSRPSTPQLTKLTSIPETSSPSRALRGTRRNSTTSSATPSKTPAKSKTATINESNEAENVPARRTTRKSSVSAADIHTPLKLSPVDKFQSKGNEINTKGTPTRRTRRLTSQTEVEKTPRSGAARKKPGPKSRRSKQDSESDSDIEVINLEDEPTNRNENVNSTTPIIKEHSTKTPVRMSPRLKAKSVSPKDSTVIETIDLLEDTRAPNDTEGCDEISTVYKQNEANEKFEISDTKMKLFNTNEGKEVELESLDSPLTENKDLSNKTDSFEHNAVKADTTAKSPHTSLSPLNTSKPVVESVHNDVKTTANSPHTSLSPVNTSKPVLESVVILEKLSPKVINKMCGKTSAVSSPRNSKSVTFTDMEVDEEVKSSYPKTPASIKSKSYIAMNSINDSKDQSFQSDKESNGSFKDASADMETTKDKNAPEMANDSKDSVEFHDATNDVEEINNIQEADKRVSEYTPQKRKLSTKLQSSTPMLDSVSNSKTETEKLIINSPIITNTFEEIGINAEKVSPVKQDETTTLQDNQKDVKTNDKSVSFKIAPTNISNDSEKTDDLFSKSWTHNVSGCATTDGKIDTLAITTNDEEAMPQSLNVEDDLKTSPIVDTRKEIPKENNEQKEEEEEDAESFQKLEFIDDEAMDVDDNYQSGDSMDEEERKEMLENEILDEGESIGSEDTEESNEEDDEDNASFVTSDSEESLLEYSDIDEDNDEDFIDKSKNSNKKNSYNRILITSESEDDSNPNFSKTNSDKTKENNKSNQRNRILSSSESEIEQEAEIHSVQTNSKRKSSDNSEKPLTFEVSRMIDDTTDDDDNDAKEPSKPQHTMEATVKTKSKSSNDQASETKREENTQENDKSNNIVNDGNHEENSRHEQETRNETELNTSQGRDVDSETANGNGISETVESTISSPTKQSNRRSQSLSRSICQKIADDKNEEPLKASTECDEEVNNKPGCGVLTSHININTNTLNRSMERSIRKSASSINSSHKSNKTTGTIDDADIISTENKSNSSNDSDSSENINERLIVDEGTKSDDLDDVQSQNESNDDENIDGEDIEIPETQEVGQAFEGDSSDESSAEETVDELTVGKSGPKLKNSGLSLSFCQAKQKRITVKDRIRHSSFSIGVTKTEDINQMEESGSSEADKNIDKQDEEELEKLAHSYVQFSTENRKRKSMLSTFAQNNQEFECKKISKRNSLQPISNEDFNPSKSLLENIEEQKRKLQSQKCAQKSRFSKSFCDSIQYELETLADNSDTDVTNNTNKSLQNASKSRLSKSFCGPIQETAKTEVDNSCSDFGHILDRCDEILDAANRAKLECKQNYKKSRLIIPKSKKESKHSLPSEGESANDVPEIKKDIKQSKEKTTLALEQAFKASAKIILKEASKPKKEKLSLPLNEETYADKRLPMQLLESISNSQSHTETKKSKRERAREPIVQRLNSATGEIVEEVLSPPKKKRAILNRIELPTGIVLEEPVTPKKKINNGFRESPITPRTLGFKVRHILTAGQDKVPQLPTSHSGGRKRKEKIVDPKLVLPKPQWSQSGVFLEEVLPNAKMQGVNTMQTCGPGANSATVNALNFKTSTLFRNNVPRETSHELLKRKERQYVRSRF